MSHYPRRQQEHLPKLRQACDPCHHAKVKCSEDKPCARCRTSGLQCSHSYAIKAGKPKGSRNQKTLQRLEQNRLEAEKSQDTGKTDTSRKRTRERPYDDRDIGPPSRTREFSTSFTSPLALDMQDTIEDSMDNLFSFNPRDCSNMSLDPNLDGSPRSSAIDAQFDMEGFTLNDTMPIGSTYGPVMTPASTAGNMTLAPTGLCTPELPAPVNSTRSSLSVPAQVPNFFDETITGRPAPDKPEGSQSTQCFCFSQQAFHLNQLHTLSVQAGIQRLDLLLQSINGTIHAVDCFLLCRQCSKDSSSLLVTIATTQLVLQQIQNLLSHNGSVRLSVGEYRPSQDDELAMKRLLIERAIQRCKNTLSELRRVSGTVGNGPPTPQAQTTNCCQNDVRYLSPVISRLEGLLAALVLDLNGEKYKCA